GGASPPVDDAEDEGAQQPAVGDAGDTEGEDHDVALVGAEYRGRGDERHAPADGRPAADPQSLLIGHRGAAQPPDHVGDGRGGQRRQRGGQRGHRGGQDAGQQQARQSRGQGLDDEQREDLVITRQPQLGGGRALVVAPQGQPHHQEDRELHEHDHSGGDDRLLRFDLGAAGQQALDHELVGAVGGHREHRAAQQGGEEGVLAAERVVGEHEDLRLPGLGGLAQPADAGGAGDHDDRDDAAGDVQQHLDHVHPDHGGDPTDEGVQDRDHRQDHGDGEVAQLHAQPVEDHLQRDRGGQHADPVGEQAGEQEGDPGGGLGAAPEAFAQVGVGGDHLPVVVARQHEEGDDHAAQDVAQPQLQV